MNISVAENNLKLSTMYYLGQWKNPGRQDMCFTAFVLSVLPVYSH